MVTGNRHLTPSSPRTVVIVTPFLGSSVPDGLMDAADFDVVYIESTTRAYSQIKRVRPDLVIVCLPINSMEGCRVLSMLNMDPETSHIPVVMCTTSGLEHTGHEPEHVEVDMFRPAA